MKPIKNSYLIEVNLGTTLAGNGANITFQDYPQLRDIYVTGIEVLDENSISKSPSGKDIVPSLLGITTTIIDKFNSEILHQYPCADLDPRARSGFYRDFVPFQIQLTKSFITILSNTGLAANESVMINILYITKKEYDAATKSISPRRK
jgi:hypothetical protein